MAVLVRVSVLAPDDIISEYGAGAVVRVESATSEAGSYTEISPTATIPVVAVPMTFSYELAHPTGTTTTWYRTRFSNSGNTAQSTYSDPFSPEAPEAYANLDDLLLTMGQTIADTRTLANAERRLLEATQDIDREIGYSALRSSGSRIFHGDGTGLLHVHGGIASLDTIEIRLETGGAWTTLQVQDTGWFLEGDLGDPNAADDIWYHVRLVDTATYTTFPNVRQGIRLTGTFGGHPELRRAACVAWARQRISLDPSHPGGLMSGPEDLGAVVGFDKWPRVVYDLIASERHRFWCHV